MATGEASEGQPSAVWEAFAQRHAGEPFLAQDPLYALSAPLINAVQAEVPTFFTAAQERFERDLAQTAGFGFFHGRPLGRTASDNQADPATGLTWQQRCECSAQELDDLLAEELHRDGLSEQEIEEYVRQGAQKHVVIAAVQDAYAGWLICNRGFRDDVGALRAAWEPVVRQLGGFPLYPRWPFVGDPEGTTVPGAFRAACETFYRRWGLDRMVTWEWPVPMEPDLVGGMLQDVSRLSEAGVVVFLPWYLLRGEKLDVQGLLRRARTACEADHLRDWLHKRTGRGGGAWGDLRLGQVRWLYRFHELVLARRYGPACRRHVQALDRALAVVLGRDEDTVKKLRLRLKRALRAR
jgi:hypothetical protein